MAQARLAEENTQKEADFLAENGKKPGVLTTPSGLQYEVIVQGRGAMPKETNTVQVHYEGSLIGDVVFDSSYSRGEPSEFSLEGVIPGWSEGIQLMNVGSTYKMYIPSALGYGEAGYSGVIPPNALLIFTVELLGIVQ
jgi:FKBP-type peptidyl-prolyl cis-trans isomerase